MNRAATKIVLTKQTLRHLTNADLSKARGGYVDSNITCDLACDYWSYFTRK